MLGPPPPPPPCMGDCMGWGGVLAAGTAGEAPPSLSGVLGWWWGVSGFMSSVLWGLAKRGKNIFNKYKPFNCYRSVLSAQIAPY